MADESSLDDTILPATAESLEPWVQYPVWPWQYAILLASGLIPPTFRGEVPGELDKWMGRRRAILRLCLRFRADFYLERITTFKSTDELWSGVECVRSSHFLLWAQRRELELPSGLHGAANVEESDYQLHVNSFWMKRPVWNPVDGLFIVSGYLPPKKGEDYGSRYAIENGNHLETLNSHVRAGKMSLINGCVDRDAFLTWARNTLPWDLPTPISELVSTNNGSSGSVKKVDPVKPWFMEQVKRFLPYVEGTQKLKLEAVATLIRDINPEACRNVAHNSLYQYAKEASVTFSSKRLDTGHE